MVRPQVVLQDKIVVFCAEPHSKAGIANRCGAKDIKHFTVHYLKPLLENRQLQMTIPGEPNSKNPRYIAVGTVQDIYAFIYTKHRSACDKSTPMNFLLYDITHEVSKPVHLEVVELVS